MKTINHVEKYLGEINEGIKLENRKFHISMSVFKNRPFDEVNTYCTLGLSNHLLFHESKQFQMELVFGAEMKFGKEEIAKLLLTFSERLIETEIAPYIGKVFEFSDFIYPNCLMTKLYVTTPVFFESDFQVFNGNSGPVLFPWIFPIYDEEAEFIKFHGYELFEAYLDENNVNSFWDLYRTPFF